MLKNAFPTVRIKVCTDLICSATDFLCKGISLVFPLPEDYEFAKYEDKGLSGYYCDRPDFQRLLRDIEHGKINAVACYKLDRFGRKTADLMRLLEYFERHNVALLVCSNNFISKNHRTKQGAEFNASTTRLILTNPIYCVADERAYNYFLEQGGNIFVDVSDFDGQHGISCYSKTDQCKVEDENSTFFNPKFSQIMTRKPIEEWIKPLSEPKWQ